MAAKSLFAVLWPLGCPAASSVFAQGRARGVDTGRRWRALPTESREWKGDFDGMLERRLIRVLVPQPHAVPKRQGPRTRHQCRGRARAFEQYLNKKYAKQLASGPDAVSGADHLRRTVARCRPRPGRDIAAGQPDRRRTRQQIVDFAAPADAKPNREIVLSAQKAEPGSAEALSGTDRAHARWTSSYHDSPVA